MNGFVLRGDSELRATNCVVRCCVGNGLRISDSRRVSLRNMVISRCGLNAMEICDYSKADMEKIVLSGPFQVGLHVYTGSVCTVRDLSIFGPLSKAIQVHYGGSGTFTDIVINHLISRGIALGAIPTFVGHQKLRAQMETKPPTLCRLPDGGPLLPLVEIDTAWRVIVTHCHIEEVGNYEIISHPTEERTGASPVVQGRCIRCHAENLNDYLSPCGHALFCRACWDDREFERPARCPLCCLPIDALAHGVNCNDGELCGICYANDVDMILMGCGHKICRECTVRWFELQSECPFCRDSAPTRRALMTYA